MALISASTIVVNTPPYLGTLEAVAVAVVVDGVVEVVVVVVVEVLVVGFAVPVTVVVVPVCGVVGPHDVNAIAMTVRKLRKKK